MGSEGWGIAVIGDLTCYQGTTFNFQLPLRVSNVNEDDVHDFFSSLRNSKGRPRGRPSQRLPRNSSATNLTSTDSNSPIRPISPRRSKVTSQSTPLLFTSKIESDAEPAVVEQPKKAPVTELELKRHQKSLSPPRRLDEETSPRSLVQSKRSRRNTGEDVGVSQERGTSEWDVEGVAEGKWNFTVVREIIKPNQVAVLGCVEVQGVTRQAWGCASVEEHKHMALNVASEAALKCALSAFKGSEGSRCMEEFYLAGEISQTMRRAGSERSLEGSEADFKDARAVKEVEAPREAEGEHLSVLIVDDEAINAKIVSSALKKKGFKCTCASDGTDLVDMVTKQGLKFDMVLIDSMMKVEETEESFLHLISTAGDGWARRCAR